MQTQTVLDVAKGLTHETEFCRARTAKKPRSLLFSVSQQFIGFSQEFAFFRVTVLTDVDTYVENDTIDDGVDVGQDGGVIGLYIDVVIAMSLPHHYDNVGYFSNIVLGR